VRRLALLAGIRHATLSDWETEKRQPRIPELEAVLAALGATPTEGREALALLRAPRAAERLRAETMRLPLVADLGPMPSGGDLLRAIRHRRRLYIEQVAERLSVSAGTISRWEQGKVVPSSDHLHALLTLINATPQERATLTESTLFLLPPLCESAASVETLEALCRPFLWPFFFVESTRRLREKDMIYLSLAAQAWKLAGEPRARRLLAEIYANYANYLAAQRRFAEAYRIAYSTLDLLPDKTKPENFHVRAALIAAQSSVYRSEQPAPGRGVELLQLWLPMTPWPDYKAWILSDIARYYALDGILEGALFLTEQSCEVARQGASPQEVFMRECDLAKLLLRADRPRDALPLTQIVTWDDEPFQRVDMELVRVEVLLRLAVRGEAADWLQRVYEEIEVYNLEPLRAQADTLARQF
jgi:transcriptional regulator with XRE-family HTH domain